MADPKRSGGRYIGVKYSFTGEDNYGWAACAIVQAPSEGEGEWLLESMILDGDEPFWPKYIRENEEIDQGAYEDAGDGLYYNMWIDSEAWQEALDEAGGDPDDMDDVPTSTAVVRVWDKRAFRSRGAAEDWLDEDGCPYRDPDFIPWPDQDEIPLRRAKRTMPTRKKKLTGAALVRSLLRGP